MRPILALLTLIMGALFVRATETTSSDPDSASPIAIGPIPAWVENIKWDGAVESREPGSPAETSLLDDQSKLTLNGSDYYHHFVVHLLTDTGVRQYAEQTADFSPEYEQVTWHTMRVYRDGQVLDRLPTAKFRRLQRELGLERKVFTGEISATCVLDDIRVGDILEVAYTTHSASPLLKGYMTARTYIGSSNPLKLASVIVRLPASEPEPNISFLIPPGTKGLPRNYFSYASLRSSLSEPEIVGGERVYRWSTGHQPAIVFDAMITPRADPYYTLLLVSSFKSWGSVVDWAEPIFSNIGPLPLDVQALIAEWKKQPDLAERLKLAVNWVQNDVRYFSLAIGVHNLRPRPLAAICSSRFGDCKDKAVLLTALLRELGIEAWPALVNTSLRERLNDLIPEPYAFNHAIVTYRFGDQLRWVDPTIKRQGGAPGEWALPAYRMALVLHPGNDSLTPIPDEMPREPEATVLDQIKVNSQTGEADMISQLTVRGIMADFYRQTVESLNSDQFSSSWFNFLARFYKGIQEVQPPTIKDDLHANQLVVQARYHIPDFIQTDNKNQSVAAYAYSLRSYIEPIETRRRHWPYGLPDIHFVRHRLEINLPASFGVDQLPEAILGDGYELQVERGLSGQRLVAVYDLQIKAPYVAADRMEKFCDSVDEILKALTITLHRNIPDSKPSGGSEMPANTH